MCPQDVAASEAHIEISSRVVWFSEGGDGSGVGFAFFFFFVNKGGGDKWETNIYKTVFFSPAI